MKTNEELTQDLEKQIKKLNDKGYNGGVITDQGELNMGSLVQYILKGNTQAKQRYFELVAEYGRIRRHPAFDIRFNAKASDKVLKSIKLYCSFIVRPLKVESSSGLFFGIVLKMPPIEKSASQFSDGEEWKAALVKKEKGVQVGDTVIYTSATNIVLDGERLHYVSYIEGTISEDKED